ncbi:MULTISPECIES: 30S ribosome-binding factor RbfA [Paenibacillus]|uniref:Ribosome-binding factor A n=1 Tax=Paenibacillus whitsoniae TaxID=2496558 RepID=A0A430J927_9BACL|nr:30S ribosome-binding factor RbfA [Paenibacillus whitsoniae]RTE07037.1 30S ribosome-binding factor RbfA [Paenibacillus whitsoniae]
MARVRVGRVGEQIKKELSQIVQSELKDPRIGFLTVTGVEVTNDLSLARVFLSVLGTDEEKAASLKALNAGSGYIRSELGKRIRLRKVPDLQFKFDSSMDYGSHIDSLLHKINQEGNPNV